MEQQLDEIFEYYKGLDNPQEQENLVALLREIQEVMGCIPVDIQNRIATELNVKVTTIATIIKLYPSLKSANYKHRIVLCSGGRCGEKGREIYEVLKKELQLDKEGLSKDKTVYVMTQNCLKHCKLGPNMYIDGELYSQLNPSDMKAILKDMK